MKTFALHPPKILIDEGHISSSTFGDIYHSTDGALEEAYAVFIRGSKLENRCLEGRLSIGELGFGFGITFLETVRRIRSQNSKNTIHYTSVEAYPPSLTQMREAYSTCFKHISDDPNYSDILRILLEQYPIQVKGFHRIFFDTHNVALTLIFEEASQAVQQIHSKQDAWFLDGFSPRKNPEMWDVQIFTSLYTHTKEQGTFTTYSVSRSVKDNASNAGFSIEISEGFKSKKHKLSGIKKVSSFQKKITQPNVAIIGGGISGFGVAHALCRRGIPCTIFEKEETYCKGASSNLSAVIMPLLSSKIDDLSEFYLHGFLYTIRTLSQLHKKVTIPSLRLHGALRIASVKKWKTVAERFSDLGLTCIGQVLNKNEIQQLFSITQEKEGIFFHSAGSVKPKDIAESILSAHSEILSVRYNQNITHISAEMEEQYSDIVYANAYTAAYQNETSWLPIEKIKGQLFSASIEKSIVPTPPLIPICYDGYITPINNSNSYIVGATYEHNSHETKFSESVISHLSERLAKNTGIAIQEVKDGKVCFRTTSPDRLPIIGRHYQKNGEAYANRYVSLGHGSRGLISCFLSGEIIADEILEQQVAVPQHLLNAISPLRYILRERKRGIRTEDSYPASYVWR